MRAEYHSTLTAFRGRQFTVRGGRAFTLIEILITLLLMGIVFAVALSGVSSITNFASNSKKRSVAAQLASAKLNELLSANNWQQGSQSGDFADQGMPDYQWNCDVTPWTPATNNLNPANAQVSVLDMTVSWKSGAGRDSLTISTMAYPYGNPPNNFGNAVGANSGGITGGVP